MKNIFLFFFLFIVLNAAVEEKILFTKEKIKEISKNIEIISNTIDCDKDTLEEDLKIFGLDEVKKNNLYSQLINACNSSNNEGKELFIRVMYEFFKTEIEEYKKSKLLLSTLSKNKPENGLATYLCEKFMILIGYEASDCNKD